MAASGDVDLRPVTSAEIDAFQGSEPVGWCSVAPRTTYEKLARSRTMPVVDEGEHEVIQI